MGLNIQIFPLEETNSIALENSFACFLLLFFNSRSLSIAEINNEFGSFGLMLNALSADFLASLYFPTKS